MTYRRQLAFGWSQRDRLAILVVAVTVAFLVGCVLLISAVGAGPIEMAGDYESPGTATVVEWEGDAGERGTKAILPVAEATRSDGTAVTVVGVPNTNDHPDDAPWNAFPAPPTDRDQPTVTVADSQDADQLTLQTQADDVVVTVQDRSSGSLVPDDWYVTDIETATSLDPDRAIEITATEDAAAVPVSGTPLQSVLVFFVAGLAQLQSVMVFILVGSGVLVAVTIASITRSLIHDRARTIGVARATGATPREIIVILGVRAGLLTGAGTILGCAIGVIATNTAVTIGIALGVPSSLAITISQSQAAIILGIVAILWLVGMVAGGIVSRHAANRPPAELLSDRSDGSQRVLPAIIRDLVTENPFGSILRVRTWVSQSIGSVTADRSTPRLVDWRALLPMTATLIVFVAVVLIVGSLGATATPLLATDEATVTDSDAPHPLASNVPVAQADAFEAAGHEASPEILGFAVVEGEPVLVRGAQYDSFAAVTDADVVDGRAPAETDEAVVGHPVANRLDLDIGDDVLLGGSIRNGFTQVTIVGVYDAPGGLADGIVVPLDTVRGLTGTQSDHAQSIRLAEEPIETDGSDSAIVVSDVRIPETVPENDTVGATVTMHNLGTATANRTITATFRSATNEEQVAIPPGEVVEATVTVPSGDVGTDSFRLEHPEGATDASVTVMDAGTPILQGLPEQAPPGSTPTVRVVDQRGAPISDATLHVDDQTVTTDEDGTVRLPPLSEETYEVVVQTDTHTVAESLTVTPDADRSVRTELTVDPESPSVVTRPTATVQLSNPWNESVEHTIRVDWPGGMQTEDVRLEPGEAATVEIDLPQRPPGSYSVVVLADGTEVAATTVTVTGDERIGSALAAGGQTMEGSGLGQALEAAVGNLYTALVTLIALAGLMSVGALVASLSSTIHASRRTIGVLRATGAGPLEILWLVCRDTARVGCVAALLAGGIGTASVWLLARMGLLTVYGIDIGGALAVEFVIGAVGGAVLLTLLAAAVVTVRLLQTSPSTLLSGRRPTGDRRD